jgi:predicted RNA-binding protein with RPS1 domain
LRELLETFGVSAFLVIVVIAVWRAWPAISKSISWFASEYINQVKERVSTETEIEARLISLGDNLEKSIEAINDNEKKSSQRVNEIKSEFQERLKNIEVAIAEKIWPALSLMISRMDKRVNDVEPSETIERMKTQRVRAIPPSLLIDTEEFRKMRESERKEQEKERKQDA